MKHTMEIIHIFSKLNSSVNMIFPLQGKMQTGSFIWKLEDSLKYFSYYKLSTNFFSIPILK